jgi:hypothetical protein
MRKLQFLMFLQHTNLIMFSFELTFLVTMWNIVFIRKFAVTLENIGIGMELFSWSSKNRLSIRTNVLSNDNEISMQIKTCVLKTRVKVRTILDNGLTVSFKNIHTRFSFLRGWCQTEVYKKIKKENCECTKIEKEINS